MENFFTPEKLTQLRELAMEEIAFRLDRCAGERSEQRSGEAASGSERIMVCLSSRSPRAAALVAQGRPHRRPPGRALVRRLRADAPRSRPNTSTPPRSARSATIWTWPGSWAAPSLAFKGADLISTIAAFVKEYGITHIVLGRTRQPWYRRWFGRSVLDRLLQVIPGVDVIVVDNSPPEPS